MKSVLNIVVILSLISFTNVDKKKIRVFLAGDSTLSVKETKVYPETGWGMPFVHFFDSSVIIDNRAKNGRSTRTFISEGLWDKLIADVKEGDYVFIQFGHNDESKEKTDRYTTPLEYKANLTRFIAETRARKGVPVLLTPVSRRRFKDGTAIESHQEYSKLVREIAEGLKVHFIDLDEKSRAMYQKYGEETSKLFFLQLAPGEHPNYPDGKIDNTHFNELGARMVAQLVLEDLKKLDLELKDRIVKPVKK
jgi:lysophospholipase L1-like esterase